MSCCSLNDHNMYFYLGVWQIDENSPKLVTTMHFIKCIFMDFKAKINLCQWVENHQNVNWSTVHTACMFFRSLDIQSLHCLVHELRKHSLRLTNGHNDDDFDCSSNPRTRFYQNCHIDHAVVVYLSDATNCYHYKHETYLTAIYTKAYLFSFVCRFDASPKINYYYHDYGRDQVIIFM